MREVIVRDGGNAGGHDKPSSRVLVVEYDVTDLTDDELGLLVGEAEAQAERTKGWAGMELDGTWVEYPGKPDVNVRSRTVRAVW